MGCVTARRHKGCSTGERAGPFRAAQGSGKTHTLREVQAQAADHLFQLIGSTPGRDFAIHLTALEIYNEARGAAPN